MSPQKQPTEEQLEQTLIAWDVLLEEKDIDYLKQRGNEELWDEVAQAVVNKQGGDDVTDRISGKDLRHYFSSNGWFDDAEMHSDRCERLEEVGTLRYEQIRLRDYPEETQPDDNNDDAMDDEENDDQDSLNTAAAGLQISVSKVKQALKDHFDSEAGGMQIEDEAAVYMSATLEYLTAEVLEWAGNSASDFQKNQIDSGDIAAGLVMDPDLHTLFTLPDEVRVPSCLLDTNTVPIRIDVYWRAHNRFPGGNCDSTTIRYRLDIQESSLQAEKKVWWNFDGEQSIGSSGPLSQVRCKEIYGKLQPTVKEVLRKLIMSEKGKHVRQEGSHYHIWDNKSRDSNAYDTEWTSVEILVYDDEKSSNPFFKLTRQCLLGPQYGAGSDSSFVGRHAEATPEQLAVMDVVHDSIGVARRVLDYMADNESSKEQDGVVYHDLAAAIPYNVQPVYFA